MGVKHINRVTRIFIHVIIVANISIQGSIVLASGLNQKAKEFLSIPESTQENGISGARTLDPVIPDDVVRYSYKEYRLDNSIALERGTAGGNLLFYGLRINSVNIIPEHCSFGYRHGEYGMDNDQDGSMDALVFRDCITVFNKYVDNDRYEGGKRLVLGGGLKYLSFDNEYACLGEVSLGGVTGGNHFSASFSNFDVYNRGKYAGETRLGVSVNLRHARGQAGFEYALHEKFKEDTVRIFYILPIFANARCGMDVGREMVPQFSGGISFPVWEIGNGLIYGDYSYNRKGNVHMINISHTHKARIM